jgi:replicative DNA helicase
LGCLILEPSSVAPVLARIVTAADYFDHSMGKLVMAAVQLHQAGKSVADPYLLLAEYRAMGLGELIDLNGLNEAIKSTPHYSRAQEYAEQIRDFARLRKLVSLGEQMKRRASEPGAECEDVLSWLDSQVLTVRHGAASGSQLIGEVMLEVVRDYEARLHTGEKPVLLSGFPTADERGFVFAPGELTVLAARTSMGKTTLATQIGMYHAARERQVLMASLEMRSKEVASRLLATASGNNHQALRIGNVNEQNIHGMMRAVSDVGDTPFRIWSPGRVKVGQIHAMASLDKARYGIQLLIVDLLQCVKYDDPRQEEHVAFGQITKGLRDIAQQLQIPVILLAQLNRGAEGERPTLKSLKGSGEIEQDADVIAFLHAASRNSETVELMVAKNRFGAPGSAMLKFLPAQTRFADPNHEPLFDEFK